MEKSQPDLLLSKPGKQENQSGNHQHKTSQLPNWMISVFIIQNPDIGSSHYHHAWLEKHASSFIHSLLPCAAYILFPNRRGRGGDGEANWGNPI